MVVCAILLQRAATGEWGTTPEVNGSHVLVSPVGVSVVAGTTSTDCRWWPVHGDPQLCGATAGAESAFARIRTTYPLLQIALWLSIVALFLVVLRVGHRALAPIATLLVCLCSLAAVSFMVFESATTLAALAGKTVQFTQLGALAAYGALVTSAISTVLIARR